jgi:hypothetical protein
MPRCSEALTCPACGEDRLVETNDDGRGIEAVCLVCTTTWRPQGGATTAPRATDDREAVRGDERPALRRLRRR